MSPFETRPPAPSRLGPTGPLVTALILLPFVAVPVAWVLMAQQRLPPKWFAFGVVGLMIAALVVVFRNSRRFHLILLAATVCLEIDLHISYRTVEQSVSSSGYYISIALLPLAALYGRWIWDVMKVQDRFRLRRRLLLPVSVYVLFCVISISQAIDPELTRFELVSLVYCLAIFIYLAGNVRDIGQVRLIVGALIVTVAVQSLLAFAQAATGSSLGLEFFGGAEVIMMESYGTGIVPRASGTLGHPNSLAIYLELVLPLTLGAALLTASRIRKWLTAVTFLLGAAALVLTLSRGGILAGAAMLVVFLFVWGKRAGKLALVSSIMVAAFATVVALLTVIDNPVKRRFVEDRYETAFVRVPLLQVAGRMIEHNYWLGVGLNNYSLTAERYDFTPERISVQWPAPVHNLYLLVLAETGIFALLALIAFFIGLLLKGIKAARAPDLERATYAIALTAGVASLLIHGTVDYAYLSKSFYIWFIAGLLVGLRWMPESPEAVSTK